MLSTAFIDGGHRNGMETKALVTKYEGNAFLVFRRTAIQHRMRHDLPYRWIKTGPGTVRAHDIIATVNRGEYYAFQLGVYALRICRTAGTFQ